ncbi:MurR/RpiR family transcriptional regulator [Polycladidibacter stylochi]|uniref:MurR/RpiR family transcriptional regulator n=1 Tax=Polycladidibacter stylochi TaxID=1807766 RepID=UPI0008308FCF|nr:MurR/RpiR family transcriptional regulator [Pseudovibrio stylochi]
MNENSENILDIIEQKLPSLKRSQEKVAHFVLSNPEEVTNLRLSDIAAKAEVSEPSVIRFCVSVGYSGFQELKIEIAKSLAYASTASHSAISADDGPDEVIAKIFDFNMHSLNRVRSKLSEEQILSAVDIITTAQQIQFFGLGASGISAIDAQQKFPLFGKPCGAVTDSHQMIVTAAMLRPGDVVIAISNTGATREILQACRVAQMQGAKVIGLSGSLDKPLAQRCDCPIVIETLENTDLYTPTISRIAAMIVIDIISTLVSMRLTDEHQDKIIEMKRTLSDVRATGFP